MVSKDTGESPKKKKPKKRIPSQRERFIAAAKESDADESGETFERAFKKIVPSRDI